MVIGIKNIDNYLIKLFGDNQYEKSKQYIIIILIR